MTRPDADVAVIGVGSVGSMAAWQLARRGCRVLGLEQFAPGHDRSGAGGDSRLFRMAYLEGAEYVPLLAEAREQWKQLERETGRRLLTQCGGLTIGRPGDEIFTAVRRCAEDFGLDHEILGAAEAARRYPQHRFGEDDLALVDREAGFLRPELAVTVAAERAEQLGATILRRTPVTAIEPDSDGVTVRAAGRTWRASTAVVAAGAWTPQLISSLQPAMTVKRLVLTWFLARDPAAFLPDRFPVFVREAGGAHVSGVPTLDGISVKIGLNDVYGAAPSAREVDRTVDDADLDPVRDVVARYLNGLHPEPVRTQVYMDGFSFDRHGIVGPVPGLPHVIALTGFSGHGFKMASAIGLACAEMVLEGGTRIPHAHLSPDRLANRSSAAGVEHPIQ